MNLDADLQAELSRVAERSPLPALAIDAVLAGASARRRRHRLLVATSVAGVTVLVAASLVVGLLRGGSGRAVVPAGSSQDVPFCIVRDGPEPREVVRWADGREVPIRCAYQGGEGPGTRYHHQYIWHHAGRTVVEGVEDGIHVIDLLTPDGARRIHEDVNGRPGELRIGVDGRFVAWLTGDKPGTPLAAPGHVLHVYDAVAGRQREHATVPVIDGHLRIELIDSLGRVYVSQSGPASNDPDRSVTKAVFAYDVAREAFTRLAGITERWPDTEVTIAYPTRDGFAVRHSPAFTGPTGSGSGRSLEGRVTAGGLFEPLREVPLGVSSWSPEGTRVLHATPEGFWVQSPADDFESKVVLDEFPFADEWGAQWESETTVLVALHLLSNPDGRWEPPKTTVFRCSATTGACEGIPRVILPLTPSANPPG